MEVNALAQKIEKKETDSLVRTGQYVVFTLDGNYFAISINIVERIVRSVIITPVPGTPENVLGVINMQGQVLPVFNIRRIFGLLSREIHLNDQIIIARTSKQTISFVVDTVRGITNRMDQKVVAAKKIFPGMEKIIEGLIFFENGMILIYDLEKLIAFEDMEPINIERIEQKMKEFQIDGKKTPGEMLETDPTEVKRREGKTQTEKIRKRTTKRKKSVSGELKVSKKSIK